MTPLRQLHPAPVSLHNTVLWRNYRTLFSPSPMTFVTESTDRQFGTHSAKFLD